MLVPGPAEQDRVQGLLGLDQLLTPSPPLSTSPCWPWLQCAAYIQFLPFPWVCRGQKLPSAPLLPPQFHDVLHGNKTASLPCWEGAATAKDEPPLPAHGTARHPCASCGAKRTPRCWGGDQNPEFPFANRGWDPAGPGYLLAGVAGDWPVVVQGPTYQCRMLPCSSRAFLPSRLLITMSCLHLKRRFPAIVLQDLQLDAKRSAYQPPPQHRGKAKAPLPSPAKLPGNHVGLINCCLARGVAVEIAICSEFRQLRRNRDSGCPQA